MSSDALETKQRKTNSSSYNSNNTVSSSRSTTPPSSFYYFIMKILICLLLMASALVVRGSQMVHDGGGESTYGEVSRSSNNEKRAPLMMQASSRSASVMASESTSMAHHDEGVEMMASADSSASSIGGDMMKAWDDSMQKLQDSSKNNNEGPIERMLVHSGHVSLNTWKGELKTVVDKMEELLKKDSRGYVESRSSYNKNNHGDNNKLLSMDLHLRVRSQHFVDTVAAIQALVGDDMVESVSLNSQDVTDNYVDASSRADTLDASRNALRMLMEKAQNVNDVMTVQRELNRLTQQYESQKSRALNLKSQADMSSLSVHIEEKMPKPSGVDGAVPWFSPVKTFSLAWSHMGVVCGFVGETVVYAAAWAIPLVILYLVIVLPIVKTRKQQQQKSTMPSY